MIYFHNIDCMEFMKDIPDQHFDLAIVDPPYGGGGSDAWDGQARSRFGGIFDRYEIKMTRTGGGGVKGISGNGK